MERLKKWADPLTDTADSALCKALDAADTIAAEVDRPRTESFVDHLLAIPDIGDDADFDPPRSEPRVVEL